MFIDTNILVYARIPGAPDHDMARAWLDRIFRELEPMRISRQVVREYVAALTRPQTWSDPLTQHEILEDVNRLTRDFDILEDGPKVTQEWVGLLRDFTVGGKQIHDANIVATMLAHGERRLLTFNAGDFRRYGNRIELMSP